LEWRIPARRRPLQLIGVGVWLVAWAIGELTVPPAMLRAAWQTSLILGAWLALWTVAGVSTIRWWLWLATGSELVSLQPGLLVLHRRALGYAESRACELASIRNLRVLPPESTRRSTHGSVAFDCGTTTLRFGDGLDQAEAALVIAELQAQHALV
jgi:hypothetical protein